MGLRLTLFLLSGIVLILASTLSTIGWLQNSCVNLGTALITISFANWLWAIWGPEPVNAKLSEVATQLTSAVSKIGGDHRLLQDIANNDLGLERLWKDRRAWEADAQDGLTSWYERVRGAHCIELMGNIMWTNWFENPHFISSLCEAIDRGATARVLIYDPDGAALSRRAEAIGDIATADRMRAEVHQVISQVCSLTGRAAHTFSIALSKQMPIPALIVRVDNRLLVSPYLVGPGQGRLQNFTMQIRGQSTELFRKYIRVFEDVWRAEGPAFYAAQLRDRSLGV